MIEAVAARGALDTANSVLQRIKAVFNYAIRTERAENNPAVPLTGLIRAPKQKHQPASSREELTEFYRRLQSEQIRQPTRIAVMLIFVRAGELRRVEWAEFDFQAAEWRIPAEKMKMKAPHIVPLADWPLELLAELKEMTGYSRYLFPSAHDPEKYMSENTLSYLTGRMGYKGIATPHGFRALASSILNEQGYNPDAIERQLAHVEEDRIRAAYNRADYMDERREMMQWYSDYLRERYRQALKQIQSP